MIIGRDREQTVLGELIAKTRQGHGGTVIVRGEPGIGKTALLDHVVASAGVRALRATGFESEAELPFAALGDLLRPILSSLDDVPPLQADALRGALGLGSTTAVDPVSVEVATASLLRAAAAAEPLLLVVDDMHWLDTGSLNAVVYVARRAAQLAVAIVGAARVEEMQPAVASLPSLTLCPLAAGHAEEVLRSRTSTNVVPAVVRSLLEAAGGNPLALHELVRGLSPEELLGHVPVADPIAVSTEAVLAFRRRIDSLPAPTRTALLVTVAEGRGHVDRVLAALGTASIDATAFEPAEQHGLISFPGDVVQFRHPLVRSVVYQTASSAERRAAHGMLAAIDDDPDRRAWHLGSSVVGPDDVGRDELRAMADRALGRGADATAARALTRAAELTADAVERGRLYGKAARAASRAGDIPMAAHLFASARPLIVGDLITQADLAVLEADLRMRGGDFEGAYLDLARRAEAIGSLDPRRATAILLVAARPHVYKMEAEVALRTVQRALELVGDAPLNLLQVSSLAMTQTMAGDPHARATARAAAEAGLATKRGHLHTLGIGWPLVWLEEYDLARRFVTWAVQAQREGGHHSFLPQSLLPCAELDFRTGRWVDALEAATEARQLFMETRQPTEAAIAASTIARIAASLGDDESCARHSMEAIDSDRTSGLRAATAYAEAALGHLALARRQHQRAIGHLRRARDIAVEGGMGEPWQLPIGADLVEALLHAELFEEAFSVLDHLDEMAKRRDRTSVLAAVARCRGLLAPADSFPDFFRCALALHDGAPTPFERARTELCFGERLRRARLRNEAREHLRAAVDTFDVLGARPWAERARGELRATGETRRTDVESTAQLTAQEQEVAGLVARGATNKEVATDLFVSAKTVEFHLSNVYRKLGIRSRTELVRYFMQK
jgi:DNA-binding CsgD family transcriptional regulator